MKRPVFLAAIILFILALFVDILFILSGPIVFGVFSILGTVLVFSSGIIWFIHLDDESFHFRKPFLAIPLIIFGAAIWRISFQGKISYSAASEDLLSVGNILMSRYQVGMWLVGASILLVFVLAGSIMVRRPS